MAPFDMHPWARFFAGMLAGSWIGAAVACGGVLLLIGRRVRQLEDVNLLLRTKLKARTRALRAPRAGLGPTLVMPLPDSHRSSEKPASRVVNIH